MIFILPILRYEEAKSLIENALPVLEKYHGKEHREIANALGNLSTALASLGEYTAAEPLLRSALDKRQALGVGQDAESAALWQNLTQVLSNQGSDWYQLLSYVKLN